MTNVPDISASVLDKLKFDCPRSGLYGRLLMENDGKADSDSRYSAKFIIRDMSNDDSRVTYKGKGQDSAYALWALWVDIVSDAPFSDDHLEDSMETVRHTLENDVVRKLFPDAFKTWPKK